MDGVKRLSSRGLLAKPGEMEGDVREKVVRGRIVIGAIARVMKERNSPMEVERGSRNSILPTSMFGSETWT